jgi:biopolymer transport protein TolR
VAVSTQDGRTQTALSEINMIPFIDVVLVLLIIFMITAPVIQSGLEVNVPKTKTANELSKDLLVVTIDAKETLYLQNMPVRIDEIAQRIRQAQPQEPNPNVYFRADEDVNWGTSTRVIDELTKAGIKNIIIVTQPIERKR